MKTHQKVAGMATVVTLLLAGPALAQVSEDGMGKVLPVEIYACTYNDGRDRADLDKVTRRWSSFMDDNGVDNYVAWILTPYHYTPSQEFDFLWLGAYEDGNAMGSVTNTWLTKGGDLQDAYDKVADCGAHVMLSSAMYKAPASTVTPTSGIITMMDCKLNEGHRYTDIKAAEIKWAEYMSSNGSKAGYWHWFPAFGGGDAEFDYKVVFAYADYMELGADFEHQANGGGREASRDVFGDIDECDDPRVYLSTVQRAAQIR